MFTNGTCLWRCGDSTITHLDLDDSRRVLWDIKPTGWAQLPVGPEQLALEWCFRAFSCWDDRLRQSVPVLNRLYSKGFPKLVSRCSCDLKSTLVCIFATSWSGVINKVNRGHRHCHFMMKDLVEESSRRWIRLRSSRGLPFQLVHRGRYTSAVRVLRGSPTSGAALYLLQLVAVHVDVRVPYCAHVFHPGAYQCYVGELLALCWGSSQVAADESKLLWGLVATRSMWSDQLRSCVICTPRYFSLGTGLKNSLHIW